MAEDGADEGLKLDGTPTWIVSVVCTVIICISLFFERFLHRLGKRFMRKNQKPLFQALEKMKEGKQYRYASSSSLFSTILGEMDAFGFSAELMLMGFISLLLVVFQGAIQDICIPESYTRHMLPCKIKDLETSETEHYLSGFFVGVLGGRRRLLAGGDSGFENCAKKGKVPLLSIEAIHQLHIFIFVLTTTHVLLNVLIMLLGSAKISQWKHWENSIHKDLDNASASPSITLVQQTDFVKGRFLGLGKDSMILSWLHSFFKQIFGSVTKSDYSTMRLGFIMAHCKGNRKFDFHKYMIRALEADFKKVVGISWYLWIVLVILLLLAVEGWHAYFWIAFIPLILLFAVGTKLEHVITQLAQEVAEKHSAVEGDLVVQPSDHHFWFHRPRIILFLIHLILFQNAFDIAYFFWILTTYGYHSCMMDNNSYIIPRVSISCTLLIMCSYSTLPLYAIVTQMGSSFKPAIFEEHVHEGLVGWAQKAKMKGRKAPRGESVSAARPKEEDVQLQNVFRPEYPLMRESRIEIAEVDSAFSRHAKS